MQLHSEKKEQNDPKIFLQRIKQKQNEGNSATTVSVTEDLLFRLDVNNKFQIVYGLGTDE